MKNITHKYHAVKTHDRPTLDAPDYFRCPTCLNWSNQPATVDPWLLNNPRPISICQHCFDTFASANDTDQMWRNLESYAQRGER